MSTIVFLLSTILMFVTMFYDAIVRLVMLRSRKDIQPREIIHSYPNEIVFHFRDARARIFHAFVAVIYYISMAVSAMSLIYTLIKQQLES